MEDRNVAEDSLLLSRLARGDASSFEALFRRYWEPLYGAAFNRLKDSDEAQEVVQNLFADLWQRRAELMVKTSLRAYLYTALKYTVLDHIRAQVVREKYVKAIQHTPESPHNPTADTVAYRELESTIHQGIRRLPERCRQVFRLRRLEHYSVKEIAQQLDISPKTVENQLTKANRVLRLHLKEYVTVLLLFSHLSY